MSKTILKLYENGDIETFELELVQTSQIDNLFVIATSQPGILDDVGIFSPAPKFGTLVSEYIRLKTGVIHTFQLYWDQTAINELDTNVIRYSIHGYDMYYNHVVQITGFETEVYSTQDIFSGTVPENVVYIRCEMSHVISGLARLQIIESPTAKPYTLSLQDLMARGLPTYSISENVLTVPSIVEYDPNTIMPDWVKDTGHAISIFPEGIVTKGRLIQSGPPPIPPLPIERSIVYLKDDYMVAYRNSELLLSADGGATISRLLPIGEEVGVINQIHVFSDGSAMFCSNTKCYHSSDFLTYSESTILDMNDVPMVLTGTNNFSAFNHDRNRQIVDGVEMLVWGNYTHSASSPNRVWYTTDKGQTLKMMYEFNLEQTNAATHVHNVLFNAADNSFWIQTGDYHPPEIKPLSHFMKCQYNLVNDTWNIDTIGSSLPFKSTNMVFIDEYAYWTWDTTGGGVVRCRYDEIADVTKHEQLFQTNNDCLDLIVSDRGEFIVTQSYFGGNEDARYVWYSPDRVTFHKVLTNPDIPWGPTTCYYGIRGPNREGKVMAGIANSETGTLSTWNLTPSVFLDDLVRNAGFPDAFKSLMATNRATTNNEMFKVIT